MQAGISVDHVNHAEGIQRVSTGAGTWVRYDGTLPFCAAKLIALALVPSMKLLPLSMLIFSAAASSSFAEGTTVHAFIGTKWMETKANALEVTWSSELEGIEIRDEKVESSSPFLLRCGDDGRQYVMISIPAEDDIWPTVTEDVRATADVMAFGSDLEITGVPLSSMKAGSHRLIFVDLGSASRNLSGIGIVA